MLHRRYLWSVITEEAMVSILPGWTLPDSLRR